jgi:acyl-ACP thioesterase
VDFTMARRGRQTVFRIGSPPAARTTVLTMAAASSDVDDLLVEVPDAGRRFLGAQRVRLGDISPAGRLRLDALARYLQDVANDDAHDSGIGNPVEWVVRRTVVEVHRPAVLREDLELVTFCSGTGPSWAERRTSIRGDAGARIEAASLWVQIDATSGRPRRLGPDFAAVYGPSAAGRTVRARLRLADPVPDGAGGLPFPLRDSDLDVLGHVNNAVYWAMVEEGFGERDPGDAGRVELEHHQALGREATVRLRRDGDRLWVCDGDRVVAAARWADGQPTSR